MNSANTDWTALASKAELRILFSGGIESAVLMGEATAAGLSPVPVYVSTGTRWEKEEIESARRYLESLKNGLSDRLVLSECAPVVIEEHWAYNRNGYPQTDEEIQKLEIPGRNETLIRESLKFGNEDDPLISVIGTTADNPFYDGSRMFFDEMETTLSEERGGRVTILTPLSGLTKSETIIRGKRFPLGLTFSCVAPEDGKVCGKCIKCGLRAKAFADAGVVDKYGKEKVNEP